MIVRNNTNYHILKKNLLVSIYENNVKEKHFQLEMFFYATNSFTFSFVSTACTDRKSVV